MNYASSGYLFMIILTRSGPTSLFPFSVPTILSTTHPLSLNFLHFRKWYIKRSCSLLPCASGLVLYLSFSFFHILNLFLDATSISWAYKHTKISPILKTVKSSSISSSPSLSENKQENKRYLPLRIPHIPRSFIFLLLHSYRCFLKD